MLHKKTSPLLFSLTASLLMAEEADIHVRKSLKEGNYKIVPLISSNPTSGTGVGGAITYLYSLDPDSSPSQLLTGAQYTNTKSWSAFAKNDIYLYSDKLRSTSVISVIHNKSQFDIPADIPIISPPLSDDENIQYDIDILFLAQMLMYKMQENIYAGGHIFYVSQTFSNANDTGKEFLIHNGAEDAKRATLGLDLSYDTRNKKEKYFPRDAEWIMLQVNYSPTFLGADENYASAIFNARFYRPGIYNDDVWASQFYGFYSTENTPDGALAALGSRKVLRGFPIGKYKARYMTAAQTEYRYQIPDTKFRAVAFVGMAELQGGSLGGREDDGFYYSGGVGLRYAIQQKAGVDLHLDLTENNDGEFSVYVGVNQAF